jgi:hypothetical protein
MQLSLTPRAHASSNFNLFELVQKWALSTLGHEAQEVPRCDKTAATRQDKAIHIVTAARQQHFSVAALARNAINGKRSETRCNETALDMRSGQGLCSFSPTLDG